MVAMDRSISGERPNTDIDPKDPLNSLRNHNTMTSVAMCTVCSDLRFVFDSNSNAVKPEGEVGFKNSCCGKCSNPHCPDHGECTCFDAFQERMLEDLKQRFAEGWQPPVADED